MLENAHESFWECVRASSLRPRAVAQKTLAEIKMRFGIAGGLTSLSPDQPSRGSLFSSGARPAEREI